MRAINDDAALQAFRHGKLRSVGIGELESGHHA